MKFPITRESLQAFDIAKEQEELQEEELQKHFILKLESICNNLKQTMPSNSKEKRFVLRNITEGWPINVGQKVNIKIDEYHSRLIEKLKETFIGCDIIMDPLKTYIIIDWS